MNDSEIIRKAVELADGWGITMWLGRPMVHCPIDDIDGFHIGHLPTVFLDALAAQLVRQVDALKMAHIVIAQAQSTVMWPGNGAHAMGEGRTMNTLRAIVESGVLDG